MAYVRQCGDGQWLVQVSVPASDPLTGKRKKLTKRVTGTKQDVQRAIVDLEYAAQHHHYIEKREDDAPKTWEELLAKWLDAKEGDLSPNTFDPYRRKIDSLILPVIGKKPLKDLTTRQVDLYLTRLRESGGEDGRGLSVWTVKQVRTILRSAATWAMKYKWLDDNPIALSSVPGENRHDELDDPDEDATVPTIEALIALMEAARAGRRPEFATMLFLAATTGMRREELCGLRLTDLEADRARIKVRRAVVKPTGKPRITKAPKNNKARSVGLADAQLSMLLAHVRDMQERAEAAGVRLRPDAYLFSDEFDGSEPWYPITVTRAYDRCRDQVPAAKGTTFMKLRNFHSTHGLNLGFPVSVVANRNGHDPAMLLRTYALALPQADRELAEAMTGLLTQTDTPVADLDEARVRLTNIRRTRRLRPA